MKRLFAKADKQKSHNKIYRNFKCAVCILMALGAIGYIGLFIVKNIMHIGFGYDNPSQAYRNDYISIGYLPEGFELTDDSSDKYWVVLEFEKDDKYIRINRYPTDASTSIDTEDSTVSDIKIHSANGKYIDNPDFQAIIWFTDDYICDLFTNISKDETIRIAESVTDR